MIYLLYALAVVVCVFLILVILLQQGSGADLSVFGGGASQTAFGARGTTQIIHKLTVWGFVAFILLTLAIAVLQGAPKGSSIMSGVETEPVEAPAAPGETGAEEEAATPAAEEAPAVTEEVPPAGDEEGAAEDGGEQE